MTDASKRELDAMAAAINYSMGYFDALAGWAREQEQRDSAMAAHMTIQDYLMAAAPRPREQEEEREQEELCR